MHASPDMSGPEFDERFERLEALVRAESAETRAMIADTRALVDERTADTRTLIDERTTGLRRLIDQNRSLDRRGSR